MRFGIDDPAVRRALQATCLANTAGSVLSFVFNAVLSPLPPDAGPRAEMLARNVPLFLGAVIVLAPLVLGVQRMTVCHATRSADPRRIFRLPLLLIAPVAASWAISIPVFMALNWTVGHEHQLACRIGLGIAFAGAAATTLNYLLIERALRPVFAETLKTVPPRGGRIHTRLIVSWLLGSAVPLGWIGATLVDRTPQERAALMWPLLYLIAFALISGYAVHAVTTHAVSDPIDETTAALRRIGAGDLDTQLAVTDRGELGELQVAVNAMTAGLRERRVLEDVFGRFVSPEVAKHALAGDAGKPERCEATVLFTDLVGSTRLAEERSPEDLLTLLNDFFAVVADAVAEHGGWVNGFDGDGAICVFGPPAGSADHAERGLRCARDLAFRIEALRTVHPSLVAGIGVSTGYVVAGQVGAADRHEYTVIGAPVNEAARLTEAAKSFPTRTLASDASVRAAGDEATSWRAAGQAEVRGAGRAVDVWVPMLVRESGVSRTPASRSAR